MTGGALRVLALVAALTAPPGAFADDPASPAKPAPPPPDPAKVLELLKSKDRNQRLAAAKDAASLQDDGLVAPLVGLLADPDPEVRRAGIAALGARESADSARKAANGMQAHLRKIGRKEGSEAESEVIATADALGALAQPSSVEVLLSDIVVETAPDVVRARLMAVANVPAAEAIDGLIAFLGKRGRGANDLHGHHCIQALKWATGESRGVEVDVWRSWWKDAKKEFDFKAAAERRAKARAAQAGKERDATRKKDDSK